MFSHHVKTELIIQSFEHKRAFSLTISLFFLQGLLLFFCLLCFDVTNVLQPIPEQLDQSAWNIQHLKSPKHVVLSRITSAADERVRFLLQQSCLFDIQSLERV